MQVKGNMIHFVRSFLSDRLIKVRVGNTLSSPFKLEEGVPQGSVLSVTCFAVAINSVISEISSPVNASLFVDDLAIYCTTYDAESACRYIQKFINSISEWAKHNGFKFSTSKTVTIRFTRCKRQEAVPHLKLDDAILPVTQPFHESRLCWIPDPTPSPPRRMEQKFPVPPSDSSDPIPSGSVRSHNSNVSVRNNSDNQASAIATSGSSGAPLTPSLPKKCRRRRRRQARRAANQNRPPSSAAPVTPDERWANERTGRSGATQPLLEDSDPTSRMRTAVYPHSQIVAQPPISAANENSPFHLGLELGEFPGLYKPADPDPRQDSTARPFRVKNSGSGISSPPYLQPYTKPFSGRPARPYMTCPTREAGGALRSRFGIVYPLLPRAQCPETNVAIDAALPEPAAVGRQELPPTVVEIESAS